MNITPETIAEMAAMEREMTPQQALQNLDNVASEYAGKREDHLILRSAVRLLQKIINEHARMMEAANPKSEEPESAGGDAAE